MKEEEEEKVEEEELEEEEDEGDEEQENEEGEYENEEGEEVEEEPFQEVQEEEEEGKAKCEDEEEKTKATAASSAKIKKVVRKKVVGKRPASRVDEEEVVWGVLQHQALSGNVRSYLLCKVGGCKKHLVAISHRESQEHYSLVETLCKEALGKLDDSKTFAELQSWAYQRKQELLA